MTKRMTTPFGAQTTAMEDIEGVDLIGKRAIVTGGASGVRVETARALAKAGAEVTLAVRNIEAGEDIATNITATAGNQNVHVGKLDLADFHIVDEFVKAWIGPLRILVNNAGIMASPELKTPQLSQIAYAALVREAGGEKKAGGGGARPMAYCFARPCPTCIRWPVCSSALGST